jgi:hypothetical protein
MSMVDDMGYLKHTFLLLLLSSLGFSAYYEDFSTLGVGTTLANGSRGIEYGCWGTGCFDSISTAPTITFFNGKNYLNMSHMFGLKIPYAVTNRTYMEIGLVVISTTSEYGQIGLQNGSFYPSGPTVKLPLGNGYGAWENTGDAVASSTIYVFRNDTGALPGVASAGTSTISSGNYWILRLGRNESNISITINGTQNTSAINDTYQTNTHGILYVHSDDTKWMINYIRLDEATPEGNASLTINSSVSSALTNTNASTFISGEPMIPLLTLTTLQNTASANITADVTFNLTGLTYPMTLSGGNGTLYNFAGSNITFLTNVSRQANMSFHLYFVNITDNVTLNSTILFTLSFLNISNCSSGFPILNFSFYSQETPTIPLLSDMGVTFELSYLGIKKNLSLNVSSVYNLSVCTNLVINNLTVSSTQTFTGSNGSYRNLFYYLLDFPVTPGTTQPINLYSAVTYQTVPTRLIVIQGNGMPVPNIYVQIQRYYPGTNQLFTVSMARTDSQGFTDAYLVPNNIIYRFLLISNGQIVYTSDAATVSCDPGATQCTKTLLYQTGGFYPYASFIGGVGYGCTEAVNLTGTITCTTNNPSGTGRDLTLNVYELSGTSNLLVCSNTLSVASGTVVCGSLHQNKSYYYEAHATIGSSVSIGVGTYIPSLAEIRFGREGLLVSAGVIITLALVGLFAGMAGAVLGAALGFCLSLMMKLIALNYQSAAAVVVLSLVFLWLSTRRR